MAEIDKKNNVNILLENDDEIDDIKKSINFENGFNIDLSIENFNNKNKNIINKINNKK